MALNPPTNRPKSSHHLCTRARPSLTRAPIPPTHHLHRHTQPPGSRKDAWNRGGIAVKIHRRGRQKKRASHALVSALSRLPHFSSFFPLAQPYYLCDSEALGLRDFRRARAREPPFEAAESGFSDTACAVFCSDPFLQPEER